MHSKSEVHVALDEGAHAEHETRAGDAPIDEETEKAKAEFLEALDGTATSDEEEPSAPRLLIHSRVLHIRRLSS